MQNKITQLTLAQYYLNNDRESWKLYKSLIATFKDVIKELRHDKKLVKICLESIAICRELMDMLEAEGKGYRNFIKIKKLEEQGEDAV